MPAHLASWRRQDLRRAERVAAGRNAANVARYIGFPKSAHGAGHAVRADLARHAGADGLRGDVRAMSASSR